VLIQENILEHSTRLQHRKDFTWRKSATAEKTQYVTSFDG